MTNHSGTAAVSAPTKTKIGTVDPMKDFEDIILEDSDSFPNGKLSIVDSLIQMTQSIGETQIVCETLSAAVVGTFLSALPHRRLLELLRISLMYRLLRLGDKSFLTPSAVRSWS